MVLIRRYLWTGRLEWIRPYHPNMMVLSLAFIVPTTTVGTAMVVGAVLAAVWAKRHPGSYEDLGYGIAAGLMAGEGIGGVVNAVLQLIGLSGDVWGTNFGCPAGIC